MAQLSQNHAMDAAFAASSNGFAYQSRAQLPLVTNPLPPVQALLSARACVYRQPLGSTVTKPVRAPHLPSISVPAFFLLFQLVPRRLLLAAMMASQTTHESWGSTLTACGDFSPHELPVDCIFPSPPSHGNVDELSGKIAATRLVHGDERRGSHLAPEAEPTQKGPLANFPFFKNYGGDKKTRDGQPPKRRGPKPDSKPALTRRQELNRQAQRTHRERKEMYIKALEQEVLRLKDVFGTTARERDAIAEENRRLKELLAAHGIAFDSNSPIGGFQHMAGSSYGGSSRGSVSGSYHAGTASTGYTSPPPSMPSRPAPGLPMQGMPQPHGQLQPAQTGLDYDQIGIDFVLTLEKPCMEHMQFLLVRAEDNEADVSGHALMQTCPPHSHIAQHPEEKYPHKMPDVSSADLMKLLDLSHRLPTMEGEITPVMAWVAVIQDSRFAELGKDDIAALKGDLLAKVRCYGFGAVIEEFEVRDALNSVLAAKGHISAAGPALE